MTRHNLQQITQEIASTRDLDNMSTLLVERVREKLHADVCNLFLINVDQDEYVLQATSGLTYQ